MAFKMAVILKNTHIFLIANVRYLFTTIWTMFILGKMAFQR